MAGESSIENFKNTFLKKGIARPTRYRVELTTSAGVELNFQPETVTLPSRSFVQIDDDLYGPVRKVPVARQYTDTVVLSFPVSDDQTERTFFEAWMDEIVFEDNNFSRYSNGDKEVYGTMTIETLSMSDKSSSKYVFEEVYPSSIFPVNLGQNITNDYMRLQVAMEYRRYRYEADGKSN
tara:strand:- start:119 stop:655 length:537 start_codon:yes stop_codon:yes gene_type:complete